MLPQIVLDRMDAINSTEEYNEMMDNFKVSAQRIEVREEAMHELRKRKSQFDTTDKSPTAEVAKQIKEGEADISDIGGMN